VLNFCIPRSSNTYIWNYYSTVSGWCTRQYGTG